MFKVVDATTVVYVEKVCVHCECFWDDLRQFIKSWPSDALDSPDAVFIIAQGENKEVKIPIGRKSVKDVMNEVDEQQKEMLDTRDDVDIEITVVLRPFSTWVTVGFKPSDLQR